MKLDFIETQIELVKKEKVRRIEKEMTNSNKLIKKLI